MQPSRRWSTKPELVVLVVSGATLEVGASDVWIAAAVVGVSGPVVSPDVVVHAASTAHTTTAPTNPLVFTTHLQASRVQSRTAQEVEDNGPTALLAVRGEPSAPASRDALLALALTVGTPVDLAETSLQTIGPCLRVRSSEGMTHNPPTGRCTNGRDA